MSITSASGAGAGGAAGAGRAAGAGGAAGAGRASRSGASGGRCRGRAGLRRRRASQFPPFGVGLGGLPEQGHVAQQHDRRRHDHPPGRQPGEGEGARADDQDQQHAEQPSARGKHPLVLLVRRAAAGLPARRRAASLRHLSPHLHAGLTGLHARRRTGLGTRRYRSLRTRRTRRYRSLRTRRTRRYRASGRAAVRASTAASRRGAGSGTRLVSRRVRFRRGEVVLGPLASGTGGGIPPEPPGNEHASPDGDDGDVQYRAAQCPSPRGPPPGMAGAGRPGGGFHGPRVQAHC